MEDRLSRLTTGQVAKNIVNNPRCILSMELQEKLVEISEAEDLELWADCNRACEDGLNKLLLAEIKASKNTKFFR